MHHFGHCPVCHTRITSDRFIGQSIVCGCGWTHTPSVKTKTNPFTDSVCLSIFAFAFFMVSLLVHIIHWDTHSLRILPLKAKQVLAIASTEDLKQITDICNMRSKWACAEASLSQMSILEPNSLDILEQLAGLQVKMSKTQAASETYAQYFRKDGRNPIIAFEYAKVLARLGKASEAAGYYEYVLKTIDKNQQIPIARNYIKFLISENQYNKAQQLIHKYRKSSKQAVYFMKNELELIELKLKDNVARHDTLKIKEI